MLYRDFWEGVVEDINDPMKVGRVRVRVFGLHDKSKDKIPTEDLPWSLVLQNNSAAVSGIGESPAGLRQGSVVVGYFRDGKMAQQPVVIGSIPGAPEESADSSTGFNDPEGEYPRYTGESDVNRLARGEKAETIIEEKDGDVESGVSIASGGTWDEPKSPYAAKYPHNLVYEGPSGNIKEIDDTTGAERIHDYHTSGTFQEIHPKGDQVTRVVGSNYEITIKDKNVYVKGECNITVDGAANVDVGGETYVKSGGKVTVEAPEIDVGTEGPEPIVLGDKLAKWIKSELKPWLDSHVHYGNLGAPTSPAMAAYAPFMPGTAAKGGPVYSKKNRSQK